MNMGLKIWGLAIALTPLLALTTAAQPALPEVDANVNSAQKTAPPSPRPPEPVTPAATVRGDCGPQACAQLKRSLQQQWPQAKLDCSRDRLLSMSLIANERGGQTVRFACWDAQPTKGDRFGLTQALLPYPGDEQSFLSPFPARSTYSEVLQTRHRNQTRTIQQECGGWAGDLELRERQELDQIELRCIFLANAILVDTNNDFIADGEVAKGSTVSKVLGKFLISELERPSSVPPSPANPSGNSATNPQPGTANTLGGYTIEGIDVKVFNRRTNQVTSLEQRENPYGLDMDLLITVKVQGPATNPTANPTANPTITAANLLLAIHAPGYDYPATGPVPDWNIVQTRPLVSSSASSYFFPFLVDYQCYPKVQLTATIVQAGSASSASYFQSLALGCAE